MESNLPPFRYDYRYKPEATEEQIQHIIDRIKEWGLKAEVSRGAVRVVIGIIGPEDIIREKPLAAIAGVESVTPVLKPYKLVAREFRGTNSLVKIGNVEVGGKEVVFMSGPCSVENRDQIVSIAKDVKKAGAKILRGGAFKPRTSPYAFQGLGVDGLKLLAEAREATGMPIITEIMDTKDLEVIEKYADCLQIGARNMQNFSLLKEVGRSKLPVMLKRGMSATIKDLLMSAEYILSEGNFNVLLCERGIRTFETYTRNTLDPQRRACPEGRDPSPRGGRPHPRRRAACFHPCHGPRGGCSRCGRSHGGSPQFTRTRQERRGTGPPASRIHRPRPKTESGGRGGRAGFLGPATLLFFEGSTESGRRIHPQVPVIKNFSLLQGSPFTRPFRDNFDGLNILFSIECLISIIQASHLLFE